MREVSIGNTGEMYYIKKYGINSHLKRIRVKDKKLYLRELQGKINFVLHLYEYT